MTESLATTAAQTIPVLALAGVVELNSMRPRRITSGTLIDLIAILGYIGVVLGWAFALVLMFVSEWDCLDYLADPATYVGDREVKIAMLSSLVLLVVGPIIGSVRGLARLSEPPPTPPPAAVPQRRWYKKRRPAQKHSR